MIKLRLRDENVFTVGSLLREGTYAEIREGQDASGRKVAVKIMEKDRIASNGLADCVQREVKIARSLQHKHIIHCIDVLVSQTKIFMVFDLAEGGDLHDFITKSQGYRLPEPIAVSFFLQLIEGLQHCHNSGVCHRDLKPENILLSKDRKTAMIADFGLAALSKEPVQALPANSMACKTMCGTYEFVAPEVLTGKEYNAMASDVWSLGVVLFVMLTGRHPFTRACLRAASKRVLLADPEESLMPPLTTSLSPVVFDIFREMFRLRPEYRATLSELACHRWCASLKAPASLPPLTSHRGARPPKLAPLHHEPVFSMDQDPAEPSTAPAAPTMRGDHVKEDGEVRKADAPSLHTPTRPSVQRPSSVASSPRRPWRRGGASHTSSPLPVSTGPRGSSGGFEATTLAASDVLAFVDHVII